MYIQYQFEKQRNLDLSFVTLTISKSLENGQIPLLNK
ncbi:unnamed protein product [Paramecium pentaurelia]|uniref:Uncharacterized protein n=1 Tax=Paramecium pentaurelia TaxID=43138 RepID=A0A8S1S1C8_9CILI|nr:unnamed protein product [Paramecium pentaurelia]